MTRKRKPSDPADAGLHPPQIIPTGPAYNHNALMPGLRVRHDGWTAARTQRFLDVLGHTGCVTDAARVAGLSRTGARRMRGGCAGNFPPLPPHGMKRLRVRVKV
jgi:hypothetical protein